MTEIHEKRETNEVNPVFSGQVSSEASFLGLQMTSVCGLMWSVLCVCLCPNPLFFYKDFNYIGSGPNLMTHFTLIPL